MGCTRIACCRAGGDSRPAVFPDCSYDRGVLLTAAAARLVQLAAQGLLTPAARRATKAEVLAAIARMGVLQIDTIHVVARSPYLVLFSRLGAYRSTWLDELLEE